jgi:hypothetical protein
MERFNGVRGEGWRDLMVLGMERFNGVRGEGWRDLMV